jgi:hypothetical protein
MPVTPPEATSVGRAILNRTCYVANRLAVKLQLQPVTTIRATEDHTISTACQLNTVTS